MIKVILRSREREAALVELLHGETRGTIFTNFPIKGKTRKMRRGKMYKVVNSHA